MMANFVFAVREKILLPSYRYFEENQETDAITLSRRPRKFNLLATSEIDGVFR